MKGPRTGPRSIIERTWSQRSRRLTPSSVWMEDPNDPLISSIPRIVPTGTRTDLTRGSTEATPRGPGCMDVTKTETELQTSET